MRAYVEGLARSAARDAPDLIYATTTSIARAITKESDAVPVVFNTVADPVGAGMVDSLERPGRNATGVFQSPPVDVVPRRFALIRETYPNLKRVGGLFDREAPSYQQQKSLHQKAARDVNLELMDVDFTHFEAVLKILARMRREGLRVATMAPSFTLLSRRREVAQAARRNNVALIAHRLEWAESGALVTYGAQVAEGLRLTAAVANQVLRGARPAEIPVVRAQRTELVVNQKTAKALGIALPGGLVSRADRVIT
jgi:putative ABC transport system substrate-binding protein